MNFFTCVGRALHGLPAYDSEKLIDAKRYRPAFYSHSSNSSYDLYIEKIDECDYLDSSQIEAKAAEVYKLYAK